MGGKNTKTGYCINTLLGKFEKDSSSFGAIKSNYFNGENVADK